MVTADGQARIVNADNEPDLFWALRGGGGNFGVAASFEFETHPLDIVLGGLLAHPLSAAPEVFDMYRQVTKDLPDEATVFCGLVHAPDGSGMKLCAPGSLPLRGSRTTPKPTWPRCVPSGRRRWISCSRCPIRSSTRCSTAPSREGALNYWKSAFFTELSDAAVQTMISAFEAAPSIMSGMMVEHFHGAVCRVDPTATAYPHREPGYNLVLIGQWLDPAETAANIAWVRETYTALEPFMAPRTYVNYLADDESDRIVNAYGANLGRLVELKRRYDPDNLFRLNHNIDPTG